MTAEQLNAVLDELSINPSELATLVYVTRRAVDLWRKSERQIPGPMVAYLTLLQRLPRNEIAFELDRLRTEE